MPNWRLSPQTVEMTGAASLVPAGGRRGRLLGAAGGVLYGAADATTKAVTMTQGDLIAALTSPWMVVLVVSREFLITGLRSYLESLASLIDAPAAFVPGNHDPRTTGGAGPRGLVNLDGRVLTVAPTDMEGVLASILALGDAVGARERAEEVVAGLRHRLAAVRALVAGEPPPR